MPKIALNRNVLNEKKTLHIRHIKICSSAFILYVLLHLMVAYFDKMNKDVTEKKFSFHSPICSAKDEDAPWAKSVNLMISSRFHVKINR